MSLHLVKNYKMRKQCFSQNCFPFFSNMLCKTSINFIHTHTHAHTHAHTLSHDIFTTAEWFLSLVGTYVGDDLGIICKHKKYGTMLFRKNGNILKALSKALSKSQQSQKRKQQPDMNKCKNHFFKMKGDIGMGWSSKKERNKE